MAHVARNSVWLHNSVRGAIGLAHRRLRRRPHRCAALVLGGARHALRPAFERAEHRPERRQRPARHGRRLRCRSRSARGDRHRPRAALVPAAARDSVRRVRAGGDLVRGRAGRLHADPRHPLQHPPAGRLAGRPDPHRGRRDRLRGERRRRAVLLAAGCGGRARPRAGRGVRGQRPLSGRGGRVRGRALRPRPARLGPRRSTNRCGPRRPRGGSTTPFAASWPSAA